MLIILSPSKDMGVNSGQPLAINTFTTPQYLYMVEKLINKIKEMSVDEIVDRMAINKKLALQNYIRFQKWDINHTSENSSCSILSYTGEAYRGLRASDFSSGDFTYSQNSLRILSGLYGILRPLDLIQAYRLEMGLGMTINGIKNLKEYWSELVTESLNSAIAESPGDKVLVNLASVEYSSVINLKKLRYPIITPSFKEEKSGCLKMVTVYTKRARGMMGRFLIKNRLENCEDLKAFTEEGYYYENQLSEGNNWLFVR